MATPVTGSPDASTLSERAGRAFAAYQQGDHAALSTLVDLLTPVLWHTARAQHAPHEVAEDAVQTAWLRLVDHADQIERPGAVLAWLVVTVKRETWHLLRRHGREDALDDVGEPAGPGPDPATELILSERQRTLWRHVTALPARCQELLRVIAFAERPDYAAISEALGMPVGSIGPTRGRCLARLRESLSDDPQWEGP